MSAWTLAFQATNFLILAALLRRVLFKPVARIIARRQEEAGALAHQAEEAKQVAEALRAGLEQERAEIQSERERVMAEALRLAADERARVLAQAAAEAAAALAAGRATLDDERAAAARELSEHAVTLGADIAKRLLAGMADDSTATAFLERLCKYLESLPRERVASLRGDLSPEAQLVLAVAPPLGADAAERWAARIATQFEGAHAVQIVNDAALVVGAELRLPHSRFSFSWRDGLEQARKDCLSHAHPD